MEKKAVKLQGLVQHVWNLCKSSLGLGMEVNMWHHCWNHMLVIASQTCINLFANIEATIHQTWIKQKALNIPAPHRSNNSHTNKYQSPLFILDTRLVLDCKTVTSQTSWNSKVRRFTQSWSYNFTTTHVPSVFACWNSTSFTKVWRNNNCFLGNKKNRFMQAPNQITHTT